MSKQETIYLEDIQRESGQIQEFVKSMTLAEFTRDVKTQYAVRLALAHIGEAVKRLPVSLTTQHPQIPWRQIAGMRDRLVHEYATVEVTIVWRTATTNVPELAKAVSTILHEKLQ